MVTPRTVMALLYLGAHLTYPVSLQQASLHWARWLTHFLPQYSVQNLQALWNLVNSNSFLVSSRFISLCPPPQVYSGFSNKSYIMLFGIFLRPSWTTTLSGKLVLRFSFDILCHLGTTLSSVKIFYLKLYFI